MYQKETKMKSELAKMGAMLITAYPEAKFVHCSVNIEENKVAWVVIDAEGNITEVDSVEVGYEKS